MTDAHHAAQEMAKLMGQPDSSRDAEKTESRSESSDSVRKTARAVDKGETSDHRTGKHRTGKKQ